MKPLFSNRYADAAAKTMLCSGVIHLSLLAVATLRGDLDALNAFNIVQLDLFFPSLGHGAFNFVLSYVVVLGFYGFSYLFLARPTAKNSQVSLAQADGGQHG
jgi:hypothetical protein